MKKKFEVKFLYQLHEDRDEKIDTLIDVLSSNLRQHPDILTRITKQIVSRVSETSTSLFGDSEAKYVAKKQQNKIKKVTVRDFKKAMQKRFKSKDEDMRRYQNNTERDHEDYCFDQRDLEELRDKFVEK